jgi:hypothetical protein
MNKAIICELDAFYEILMTEYNQSDLANWIISLTTRAEILSFINESIMEIEK